MALNYTGPSRLRRIFEDEYARIAHDYDRQEAPRVVVAVPHALGIEGAFFDQTGFRSLREFNGFVSRKIERLERFAMYENEKRGGKRLAETLRSELGKVSFEAYGFKQDASYYMDVDAMFFDPFYAVSFLINKGPLESAKATDIPAIFRHEMVHWDCGSCLPFEESRQAAQEMLKYRVYIQELKQVAKRGHNAVERWAYEGEGQEFVKQLKAKGPDILETAKKDIERLEAAHKIAGDRTEGLNIRVGSEALAYSYSGEKEDFGGWMNDDHQDISSAALRLYDIFAAKIASEGKLATIRVVKAAINASYSEGRDFFSFFL